MQTKQNWRYESNSKTPTVISSYYEIPRAIVFKSRKANLLTYGAAGDWQTTRDIACMLMCVDHNDDNYLKPIRQINSAN